MTLRRIRWDRLGSIALLVLVVLIVAACAAPGAPGASGVPAPSATAHPPLTPAQPGADPVSFLAWIFNPIFQAMFLVLVAVYDFLKGLGVPAAIGWAIVALTLLVRAIVIPLYRRQLVSQRRTQLLQPEIKEIQRRYKGDAVKARIAQQELFKERGISPLAGCLPLILQMPLLFIMYSVIQNGLTNQNPTAMLTIFGQQVVPLQCTNIINGVVDATRPCIDTVLPFFGGIDVSKPSTFLNLGIPGTGIVLGLSILAIASAALQLVQSRMMLPRTKPEDDDPNTKIQRQTMLFLPLISVAYGGFLPAGLFIYWITATIFSIIQQYLIVGWGGMFPLFGWTPRFATDHTPRFPVSMPPPPEPGKRAAILTDADKKTTAASTIRPRERGRQGRRGRRR
ncbi:MAG: YidC/Oxa1 family rane protein insertase [Chloroflexota bacterium]|nr:YidC/Oxa1 family rane protein insertase [Chloroflexota bacterium]HEV7604109.1 YidC/Oxa1 family membrane protein insertase [Candidatus Limnocylindrales bacterium]